MADVAVPSIATATPTAADTVLGVQGGAVKRFGVSGLNPYVVHAALSESNTGAQNIAALQAAHDALANRGGVVMMPAGAFNLAGTVTVEEGRIGALGKQCVVFRGSGVGATRLTQQTAGVATFKKVGGLGHSFEGFSLIGPGTSNPESVGIDWSTVGGGSHWRDLHIEGFGVGSRFEDATLMTFTNVAWRGNDKNLQLGYNGDIFQFIGSRCENAVTACLEIGWRAPGRVGAIQCNPITLLGLRFGASPLAINCIDYASTNVDIIGCYFEDIGKIGIFGEATQATGPKCIQFRNCFFTVVGRGGTDTQIVANLHANQESTITLEHCRSDTATFAGRWVDIGVNGRLKIANCDLLTTGAHVGWNGGTYTLDKRNDFTIDRGLAIVHDGSAMGSLPALDVRLTNGTGKTWASFTRRNGATGAELGAAGAHVADYGGQFVAYKGPLRPATPSAALPAASATYRGITVYQEGAGGVPDTIVCCMKDTGDTYSWKVIATG